MRAVTGLGPGWRAIASEAEADLLERGLYAEVWASLSEHGLLLLRAKPSSRAARALLEEHERRALGICERCGRTGKVRTGSVLQINCDDCAQ